MLHNAAGVGGGQISWKKRYEGVRCNVISVSKGWVGVNFQEKSNTKELTILSSCGSSSLLS